MKSLDPQHNRTDGHTDLHDRKDDQQRDDAFQEHLVGHKNETYCIYYIVKSLFSVQLAILKSIQLVIFILHF